MTGCGSARHRGRNATACADQAEAAIIAARAEAQAARRDAARAREQDQQRHATDLAAATARLDTA